jgi:ornithine carbamoyltransferase
MRNFLDITDLTVDELGVVLDLAQRPIADLGRPLDGLGVALIFEKPSNRTRHSMEMAVVQLGGHPVYTRGEDIAQIMSGYHGLIAARVFSHSIVERLAAAATVPVVNMLSDASHPLQALADVLTMQEDFGDLTGRTVAYVGDYNNVSRSLAEASLMLGMNVRLGCPLGFDASTPELERLSLLGSGTITQTSRAIEAVAGADAVHTDTWVSMGQESEKEERKRVFEGFTVDDAMIAAAAPGAVFMHCLPAYRGLEVAADVIDGPRSRVIRQGHNRMHAARGLMAFLVGAR